MADNTIFIALRILDKYPEKTTLIRSNLPPGTYKTSLDISPPPKSLSLHCKQINKVKKSWMVNHQFYWPPCMFLIIKEPSPQSI